MAKLDVQKARDLLQTFDFGKLFVEELGWSQPTNRQAIPFDCKGDKFQRKQIAQLSGVVVLEITSSDGKIPGAKALAAIHKEVSKLHHENLLIFIDGQRTQSLWYWVKREDGKLRPREHLYVKGQPGDLFLSKLSSMVFDISEFDEAGNVPVVSVAKRLKDALDVQRVTKKFFREYDDERLAFLDLIEGIAEERQRRWYASVLLNRLMFIYFLQRKGFIDDGNHAYLNAKLNECKKQFGKDQYYEKFLKPLFFEGFAKPEGDRSPEAKKLLGKIKYLNGGLFLPHRVELDNPDIRIPDKAFENLLKLFQSYSWNLNDTPGGEDNEINPDVLGYIFEKYINQKAFGAYYTRPEITEYLCEQTIYKLILEKINSPGIKSLMQPRSFDSMSELLLNLDAQLCRELLNDILPDLSLLDPACGSGAFLVAAMKTLINVYSAVIGKIEFLGDQALKLHVAKLREEHHGSVNYYIKREIITNNLFGVDLMEEATEIARLRLFLALVASAKGLDQLEPLPNIDFNILAGNSLIGILNVNAESFDQLAKGEQGNLLTGLAASSYGKILEDKDKSIEQYKKHAAIREEEYGLDQNTRLLQLREHIEKIRADSYEKLDQLLLGDFQDLSIKYEEATWDEDTKNEGKPKKRQVALHDIKELRPFHWGFEFDQVMNGGGFDAIITNPPWEVFQTNEKEFFQQYAATIQKKKLRIEDWEKQRSTILKDLEVREDWLAYANQFPHQLSYFKKAKQYANQNSSVDGKAVGNKPNLYSLFAEQTYNLLRSGGLCGVVIPSGIYTDLGTKGLREFLFDETEITGLFGFENRKEIFEGVHRSFKFAVLTFRKGGHTTEFPAAFMRHEVGELERFPKEGAVNISVDLIRTLSPSSISVMEFKSNEDVRIAEKMLGIPLLSDHQSGWGLELYGEELNMTRSSKHFKTTPTKFPVYEGGMIWHFDHNYSRARYWVNESALRQSFLEKRAKRIGFSHGLPNDLKNDYEVYRIAIRKIASNTNERTLISTVIPSNVFAGNSLSVSFPFHRTPDKYNKLWITNSDSLMLVSLLNSFVADYVLRSRMTTNLNLFYLYQLPIPRPRKNDEVRTGIIDRAAKLVCTTREFDELAREVGLFGHEDGATDPAERSRLRAELDGMIAHLYGLTEEEFAHILSTFPIVEQSVKDAALDAYRVFAPKPGDQEIAVLIAKGESNLVEFKSSARWDFKQNKQNKAMEDVVVKTVAALLNTDGGNLLVGVDDERNVVGLDHDYKLFGKKDSRDAYENFLTTLLLNNFGKDASALISISIHELDSKDVARVNAKPAPRPVFVKDGAGEHLYIRAGNSTRLLSTREAIDYCKMHWP